MSIGVGAPASVEDADAETSVPCGTSLRLAANASATRLSPPPTAWPPPCSAVSANEHAVSTLEHEPCSPSANDPRPAATDTTLPVAAYTEPYADGGWASAHSGRSMPSKTLPSPPISTTRRCEEPCATESTRCARATKPPRRTHASL